MHLHCLIDVKIFGYLGLGWSASLYFSLKLMDFFQLKGFFYQKGMGFKNKLKSLKQKIGAVCFKSGNSSNCRHQSSGEACDLSGKIRQFSAVREVVSITFT